MNHRFVSDWNRYKPNIPPFYLPGDKLLIDKKISNLWTVILDWNGYINDKNFCNPFDTRLHLGLLPIPFLGNPSNASVVILMMNPGLGPTDYYGEYLVPSYRQALINNLANVSPSANNFMLDPQFSWHGGFEYWHGKFRGLIDVVVKELQIQRLDAISIFAHHVAIIELIPYHSSISGFPLRLMKQLRSVQLAKDFVHNSLVPRAQRGESLIINTRSARIWDIDEGENIIVYSAGEARGASLSPRSRGGIAILKQLRCSVLPGIKSNYL